MLFATSCICVSLWIRASQVTAACDNARLQGLVAISEAAGLDQTDPEQGGLSFAASESVKARGFVAYAELKMPGFSCHGVKISFHLGIVLAYTIVTALFTLMFPLATVVMHE